MPNPTPPFNGNVPNPRPPIYGSVPNLVVTYATLTARVNSDAGAAYGHTFYECKTVKLNNATIVSYWKSDFPPVVGARFVFMHSVKPLEIVGPVSLVDDDTGTGNGMPKGFGLALEISANELALIVVDESSELPQG